MQAPGVLCFADRCWTGAAERPRAVMARLARKRRVVVVAAPCLGSDSFAEIREVERNLWVLVPHVRASSEPRERLRAMRSQLAMVCAEHRMLTPILWWYSAAPLSVACGMRHAMCVFEPMRRLGRLPHSPRSTTAAARERALLGVADLVLTPDDPMGHLLRRRHANVHVVGDASEPERSWDDVVDDIERLMHEHLNRDTSVEVAALASPMTARATLVAARASLPLYAQAHGSGDANGGTSKP